MEGKPKIHLGARDSLCSPKTQGCLGFRCMLDHNRALISKHAWNLTRDTSRPHISLLKSRYRHNQPMHHVVPRNASFFWKGLSTTISIIDRGACYKIGSRNLVAIWSDPWIPVNAYHKPVPKQHDQATSLGTLKWVYKHIDHDNMC